MIITTEDLPTYTGILAERKPSVLQQAIARLETTLRAKPPVKVSLAPIPPSYISNADINWCNSDRC